MAGRHQDRFLEGDLHGLSHAGRVIAERGFCTSDGLEQGSSEDEYLYPFPEGCV